MAVIVAIPARDDYVWEVSSEKVPHLTLLYLGEGEIGNTDEIIKYLEHAVKTVLNDFYLTVDRRGELGDKSADVLFFKGYGIPRLREFRSHLLTNGHIYEAYNSVEQFPEWIPHLTLGYPETPANPVDPLSGGIIGVRFDRIAFWNGDSEGPEFQLEEKPWGEVAMMEQSASVLSHYGVKGMKWGVVRDKLRGSSSPGSEDHIVAKEAHRKLKKHGVQSLSNAELQSLINRMDLEQRYSRVVSDSSGGEKAKKEARKFIAGVLKDVGRQQITRIVNDQATKAIARALK